MTSSVLSRAGARAAFAWLAAISLPLAAQTSAQPVTFVPGPSGFISATIATGNPTGGLLNYISADLTGTGRRDLLLGIGSFPPNGKQTLPMRVLRPNAAGNGMEDVTRQLFGNGALPGGQHPREYAVADFNRDGKPDIFVADHGYDTAPFDGAPNVLLLSNADGTLSDRSSVLPTTPDFTHCVAVADINGDGFLDIYVGNVFGSGRIGPYFLMGGANGIFTQRTAGLPPTLVSLAERFHVAAFTDVDGDGLPDLILGTTGYDVPDNIVLLNDGTGDFTKRPRMTLPRGAFGAVSTTDDIIPFDVNNDGRIDLLILSTQSGSLQDQGAAVQVLVNRGGTTGFDDDSTARLGTSASRTSGRWLVYLRILDMNGDGYPDILGSGFFQPSDSVPFLWINNKDGTFRAVRTQDALPANEGGPLEPVDVDGDGLMDLVKAGVPPDGRIFYQTYLNRTPRSGPRDYSDMWWAGSAENGWGMSVQQHANGVQFNALYVYDNTGKPVWYVMPGGTWSNNFTTYTGQLYAPTGSPLNNFVTSAVVVGAPVGTLAVNYISLNTAEITYTINGISGIKRIQRQAFGTPEYRYAAVHDASAVAPAGGYTFPRMVGDMWWGGTVQSGWGVSVAQQYRTLFSVWYTYGLDARPTWYVMPGGTWQDNRYIGDLFSTTAAGWLGAAYNPASLQVTRVGTAEFNFTSNAAASFSYLFSAGPFSGTEQVKNIQRQVY